MVTNPKAITVAMEAGTTTALITVAMVAAEAEATAEAVTAAVAMAAMVAATAAMVVATGPAVNSAATGGMRRLTAATALTVTTAATILERGTRLPQATTTTTHTGTWILVQRIISQVIWNVYTCMSATEEPIKSRWLMVWVCLFRTLVIQT
jgi:hypothetical protein